MKLKLFSIALVILFPFVIYAQSSSERLLEMKNSLNLGLQEKGLIIAAELMSRNEYKDVREETVFFIAEYHFINSFVQTESDEESNNANRAYTYYLVYKNDYPNSKYSAVVEKRLTTLNSTFSQLAILKNLFDYYYTEASIVENSINFTNNLYTLNQPNPYHFFFEGDNADSSIIILDRYYDDIIVNHPEFEQYGYYWKILANLSLLRGIDFFADGLMKFDVNKITFRVENDKFSESENFISQRNKLYGWLDYLNKKHPHNSITLDLNLIFAKIFLLKDSDDRFSFNTKKHLEFVVQNELDKTHPRYMLAKEFLLNNKFK